MGQLRNVGPADLDQPPRSTFRDLGKAVIPKLWPPDPASLTPTPIPLLSATPVLVTFGVSLVIGLLAGGYPAYRASRLRPIEALRFE